MELFNKLKESVGLSSKEKKDDTIKKKKPTKKGKSKKGKRKGNKKKKVELELSNNNDNSYLTKLKNITSSFSFYDIITNVFNSKSNEKEELAKEKEQPSIKEQKQKEDTPRLSHRKYQDSKINIRTPKMPPSPIDLSKTATSIQTSLNPLLTTSREKTQRSQQPKNENTFLLTDSFGLAYNHNKPSSNDLYLSKDTITSLIQVKDFPCEVNEFALTEIPVTVNELETIKTTLDIESVIKKEEVKFALLATYHNEKLEIAIILFMTAHSIIICTNTSGKLDIYKTIEIASLSAIYYQASSLIIYTNNNTLIHLSFSNSNSLTKSKKNIQMEEFKTKSFIIVLWRYYFIVTSHFIRVMEIVSNDLFEKLLLHITEKELFFKIIISAKDKLLRVIKIKSENLRNKSMDMALMSRGDKSTLTSKTKVDQTAGYEREIINRPYDGVCYILNADNANQHRYYLVFIKIIDGRYILIYDYKNDLIIPIEFNNMIAIRINRDRYAMSIDLFRNTSSILDEKREFYFKVNKKLMLNYNNVQYARVVLFTCGCDDVNYTYFKYFIERIIEINKLNPGLFFLREVHTKFIVDWAMRDGQVYLNLINENRNKSGYNNGNKMEGRLGEVPIKSNKCECCCFKKKVNKEKKEFKGITEGNQKKFIKTLHPENRKVNNGCIII